MRQLRRMKLKGLCQFPISRRRERRAETHSATSSCPIGDQTLAWWRCCVARHEAQQESKRRGLAATRRCQSLSVPHLPHVEGQIAILLGVVDSRPGDPRWEGPDPSVIRKLDMWFIAGAQHALRSRSLESPKFFLRFTEIGDFENKIKAVLEALPQQVDFVVTVNLPAMVTKSIMELARHLGAVEALQEGLHTEKWQYLLRCLLICYNLRRLQFWLWRAYNREYQRLVFALLLMLSRAVHEYLRNWKHSKAQIIAESLEFFTMVPEPMIPVYRGEVYEHAELVDAVKKDSAKYPMKWKEKLPPLTKSCEVGFHQT